MASLSLTAYSTVISMIKLLWCWWWWWWWWYWYHKI